MLGNDLGKCIGVLNCHTHLEKVLGEDFVGHEISDSLGDKELDEREHYLGLIVVEVLVTAEF